MDDGRGELQAFSQIDYRNLFTTMHQPPEHRGSRLFPGPIEYTAGVLPYFDQILNGKREADFTQAEHELHPSRFYHAVDLWPESPESVDSQAQSALKAITGLAALSSFMAGKFKSYATLKDFPRLGEEELVVEIHGISIRHPRQKIRHGNFQGIARQTASAMLDKHSLVIHEKEI